MCFSDELGSLVEKMMSEVILQNPLIRFLALHCKTLKSSAINSKHLSLPHKFSGPLRQSLSRFP